MNDELTRRLADAAERVRAERALEIFQRDDQLGPTDRREAGFELFVRRLIEALQELPSLQAVGLHVQSEIKVVGEPSAPSISILQTVRVLKEGWGNPINDAEEFYLQCFPRNTVFAGTFLLHRDDAWVQRYLMADNPEHKDMRLAALSVLTRAAADAFAPATLAVHVKVAS